jgi:PAS domain S-box-containing protein
MKIRNKVILILVFYFAALICGIYLCSEGILLREVQKFEIEQTSEDYLRALNAFDNQLDGMSITCRDWASWDDTYDFVVTADERYIESNLGNETYINCRLNLICFFDSNGTLVYGGAFDHADCVPSAVFDSLVETLHTEGVIGGRSREDSNRGIIISQEGPMLISAEPILRSDESGPSRGTLLMGRYLEDSVISDISDITSLSITLFEYSDPAVREGLVPIDVNTEPMNPAGLDFFHSEDGQKVVCVGAIADIAGNPVLVLRIDDFRQAFTHAIVSIHYYLIVLIGISLSTSLLIYAFLRGHVITRIEALRDNIKYIGNVGDYSSRVEIDGTDEISDLSVSMNGMLDSLERGQQRLRESEERYRQIFDNAQDAMIVCQCKEKEDKTPVIVNVNAETCRLLGYDEGELRRTSLSDLIEPDLTGGFRAFLKVLGEQRTIRVTGTLVTNTGSRIPIEMSAHLFTIRGIQTFIIVGRDITERRLYESMRQEAFEQIDKNMEQFAILNDEIRNPLQVILGFILIDECVHQEQILRQIEEIDRIITELDLGWIESEKVRKYLRKYHGEQ